MLLGPGVVSGMGSRDYTRCTSSLAGHTHSPWKWVWPARLVYKVVVRAAYFVFRRSVDSVFFYLLYKIYTQQNINTY